MHTLSHSPRKHTLGAFLVHLSLLAYLGLTLAPLGMMLINSVKQRDAVMVSPLALPTADTFSLAAYAAVIEQSDIGQGFLNSTWVTAVSLVCILVLGAMAAWGLTQYQFRGNFALRIAFALGAILPMRLATVSILELLGQLDLINSLSGLILVYVAQGLPMAILVLSEFMAQVPAELKDAARCDDVDELHIFFVIVLPLIRPALFAVAIWSAIPIWNDLWFPLMLAPSQSTQTITLGIQQFIWRNSMDWSMALAYLTLATLPVLLFYGLVSRYLMGGIARMAYR